MTPKRNSMKLLLQVAAICSFAFAACGPADPNKQIDEGAVTGKIYESREIGWSIEIPKDWKITSKDQSEANDEKGRNAIEKSSGMKIDSKAFKHLISFQKNQFNLFASTSEPFKEEFPGEYEKNGKSLNEITYNAIVAQGIKGVSLKLKMISTTPFGMMYSF